MGVYLNPDNQNFTQQIETGTYIDKTMLIEQTNKRLNNADFKFVCISRPRRFGKSIAEDMLAAYYSKGANSAELFAPYKIAKSESFSKHLNKYNVIKIDLNAMLSEWKSKQTRSDNVILHLNQKLLSLKANSPMLLLTETAFRNVLWMFILGNGRLSSSSLMNMML